jgi:aminoglycoside phosphotransferase (APT) family kinase protein
VESADALAEHVLARVRPLVAEHWVDARPLRAEPLRGGHSSITLLVTLAAAPVEQVVVKVAPPGLDPVANRDVMRQARVMDAVHAHSGVPVPTVLARDAGSPPEVPPLFVMEYVEGDITEPAMDRHVRVGPADVDARVRTAVRLLAQLHSVPFGRFGLGDEPEVGLAEEIGRWVRALRTVPPAMCPGAFALAEGLRAHMPDPVEAVLLHGDWRLGNMLSIGGAIRGVIDWEIWSRSDARLDLAWFLLGADADHVAARRDPTAVGVPPADALRDDYEAAGGSAADLPWFEALVRLKLAAVWSLIAKRELGRPNPSAAAQRFASWVPPVVERGTARLADYQRSC